MTEINSLFESESETILAAANAMCVSLGLSEGADLDDLIQQIDFELGWNAMDARVLTKARKAIRAFIPSLPRRKTRRGIAVSPHIFYALRAGGPLSITEIINSVASTSHGRICGAAVRREIEALESIGEIAKGRDGWDFVEVYAGQADLFQ